MACIIDVEQFIPTWIGFGFFGGMSYGIQYGLSLGDTVGRTDDEVL